MDIDTIIDWIVRANRLNKKDPATIDKVIDHLAGAIHDRYARDEFVTLASARHYTGSNPRTMLRLYDLIPDSEDALSYGIAGFEGLERNPDLLAELNSPDRIVEYVIPTSETEELAKLQETLLDKGGYHFPERIGWSTFRVPDLKPNLATSILKVANEIVYRQKMLI